MHQALAGLLQSKLRAVILASHSSPLAHDAPSPPSTSGRCSGITMENSNGKDSLSLAVLTPTSTPQRHRSFQGRWEDVSFLLFFSFSFSPCLHQAAGSGKRGEGCGEDTSGLEISTCATQPPGTRLPPRSHTISVPGSHSGAWDSRKRFCNSIFLLALVKGW